MNIYKLLKMNSAERQAQTDLAAAELRRHQDCNDARDYLADLLPELRQVASRAHLRAVARHIDAACHELQLAALNHAERKGMRGRKVAP